LNSAFNPPVIHNDYNYKAFKYGPFLCYPQGQLNLRKKKRIMNGHLLSVDELRSVPNGFQFCRIDLTPASLTAGTETQNKLKKSSF